MTDIPDQPLLPDEPQLPAEPDDDPLPWEGDPPLEEEHGPDGRRLRHDAFTARRKHEFLKALAKTGCVEDACRLTGVSSRTVYRHQQEDEEFYRYCTLALRMVETPLELTAWQRAVDGFEEQVVVGGRITTRIRHSENLLRLFLQASNPKKYGPRPGFKRKRLLRHERKQMEREIRSEIDAELAAERPTFEEAIALLEPKLEALGMREDRRKLEEGWTKSPDGHWIPPGYAPIPGWTSPTGGGANRQDGGADRQEGGADPRDSV